MADGESPSFLGRAWENFSTSGLSLDPASPLIRRVKFLNYYLLTTVLTLLAFGTYNLLEEQASGVVELVVGAIGVAVLLLIRGVIAIGAAQGLTLAYAIILMVFLLFNGGIEGTGLLWWFCIPPGAFFLMGRRRGWWWVGGTVAVFLADMALVGSGAWSGPYTFVQLRQFIASYLVICVIMYFYETVREDYEGMIGVRTGELEETNAQLRGEMEARRQTQRELEAAKSEAERANAAKSEFLSRMSHELRTPMNSILGFSQLLELDAREPLTASQRESVSHILSSGRHLLSLINEVLDLSRIEAGRIALAPEAVDLRALCAECLAIVRPLAERRRVSLHDGAAAAPPLAVTADPGRLKQILLNLLSNAIKYNRDGGTVRVEATAAGVRAARLSVTDTGQGIPADKLPLLFEPFERLEAEDSAIEGTGIGLAIARKLAEMMGGGLTVESTPGVGSCFTVELPVAEGKALPAPPFTGKVGAATATAAGLQGGGTVLYIEDDPANLTLVKHILSRRPEVHLLLAENALKGLELAMAHRPHLILLDIHLPDMDGHEAFRRLREAPETRGIPVVAVSASALPRDVQKIKDAGVEGYLTKPLDVPLFLKTVDEFLATAPRGQEGGPP
jgi:signal transduction histidine kinase/CheY-like chemotaxis protein